MKYDCKYLDESIQEEALKLFRRTYPPEFKSEVIGASDDKQDIIIRCLFPDGVYYFKVNLDLNSVSDGYYSLSM